MVSLSLWQRYRRNGIRQTKSILASIADVTSDWVFYLNVKSNATLDEKYGFNLFIFACISSGMLLALLLSFLVSARAHAKSRRKRSRTAKYAPFGRILKMVLGLQMLVEDIPQFIIGALVRSERGNLDPYLVFTWTTSGFNFFLNLLDMIEIEDDDSMSAEEEALEENHSNRSGYDHERGSRSAQMY
ncbi:unnamed protein product [Cylindrotheca closterium]|uniref:Uncharacterized protein n=1 Tax=Cylindrotheca closterium TaxID=2856 RepID=A0AAD2CWK1_9STRA|nr:unnamed protein product [Cylindrotheca closterium]